MHVIHSNYRKPHYEAMGWLGMFFVLAGFVALSTGLLTANDWQYFVLNIVGSTGLVLNSYGHDAKPLAVLNGLFIVFALYGLYRIAS